ncbi:extracellular calcium-sensing receptor-like [Morone saxatilis]|uniref:extracellular calcium-sensing receptor-like n=1 Tax=Morone saxatilis TaxID=34816 RepID=UPI0015E249CF|nr:extracellular calcium-sensing receptor-like [Morone saxatilis]
MSWFLWLLTQWPSSALSLLLLSVVGLEVVQAILCSRWGVPRNKSLSQDGDVIIGGLFNLYYIPSAVEQGFIELPHYEPCTGLDLEPLKYTYAMVFAVEEINRNSTLLPGVKLGYHILDSCSRYPWALQAGGQPVPLLIAAASSTTGIMLSRILGPLSVPFISYLASCPCLSDRTKFPNFFRTIPSDIYQARAMAQLAIRFHWTWMGAVVENNDYGQLAIQVFQEEIQGKGVCLEFVETLQRENIVSDARRAALTIQASTTRVILIFCWYTDVKKVFLELTKINVTDRQFLASEAWSTSDDLLQDLTISEVANGVLGVAIRSSTIPGFENYLRRLHPINRPDDEFLRDLWKKEFGCTTLPPCSGTESLEGVQHPFTDTSQLRVAYNVYLAVYAAGHALHSLLSCPDTDSPPGNNSSTCFSPKHIQPIELLHHLNKVNVTTPQGEMFYFQGADIPAKYDLVNWQKTPEGPLKLVLIGRVEGFNLHLNESAIQWSTGSNQVPVSVCSESCPPGTRKANRKREPLCCFDCIPCADGEISNKTGSLHCERCPSDFWSNVEKTACVPRQLDFLSFNETLGITLTTAAVSGAAVTTAVFVVFLYYRKTPMVRANNSELSFLLLLSLKLCFLFLE